MRRPRIGHPHAAVGLASRQACGAIKPPLEVAAVITRDYDRSAMRWVADIAYLLAGLIYLPVALYHALIVGKNRRGWGQRFGAVPAFDPTVPRIWIHAVSLGEINAPTGGRTPRAPAGNRHRLHYDDRHRVCPRRRTLRSRSGVPVPT